MLINTQRLPCNRAFYHRTPPNNFDFSTSSGTNCKHGAVFIVHGVIAVAKSFVLTITYDCWGTAVVMAGFRKLILVSSF